MNGPEETYLEAYSIRDLYATMEKEILLTSERTHLNYQNSDIIAILTIGDKEVLQYISLANRNISRISKLKNSHWKIAIWQATPEGANNSLTELALLALAANDKPYVDYLLASTLVGTVTIQNCLGKLFPDSVSAYYKEFKEIDLAKAIKVYSNEGLKQKERDYFSIKFNSGKLLTLSEGRLPYQAQGEIYRYPFHFQYINHIAKLSILAKNASPDSRKEQENPLWDSSINYVNINNSHRSPYLRNRLTFSEFLQIFPPLLEKLEKAPYIYRFPFIYDSDIEDAHESGPLPHKIPAHSVDEAIRLLKASSRDPRFYNLTPLSQDDRLYPESMPDFKNLNREG